MKRIAALGGATLCLAFAGMLASAPDAQAFNVKNETPFIACVASNKGNYTDTIAPYSTNQGWYYDHEITLYFYPYDGYVMLENGQNYVVCNDSITTNCTIRAHGQAQLLGMTFQPGNVDGNSGKAAWTMFYVLDAPASYMLNDQCKS